MNQWMIQGIGAIGYILLVGSYYYKHKSQILFMQIIALLFFTLHYQLLHGITGALCNFISALMMLIILLYDRKGKSKKWLIVSMIPILVIISLLSWENLYSIFPIIASVIMLFAFLLDDEKKIRVIGFISNILWTIYGIIHLSYSTILFEVFSVIGTLIAILKNRGEKKDDRD